MELVTPDYEGISKVLEQFAELYKATKHNTESTRIVDDALRLFTNSTITINQFKIEDL